MATKKEELMEKISDPNCILSVDEISKDLNLKKSSIQKLLSNDEFMKKNLKLFDLKSKADLLNILKVLNSMAKEGDMKAIKLLFEIRDKLNFDSENVAVQIIDDISN